MRTRDGVPGAAPRWRRRVLVLLLAAGAAALAFPHARRSSASPGPSPDNLTIPFDPGEALALTPEEIASEAEAASSRLRELLGALDLFLGIDADVDARIVQRFYELPPRLQALAAELRALAGDGRELVLHGLGPEAQAAGIRLFHASRRLTLLLDEQARCAHRELPIFTSAIETLSLEIEAGSAPAKARTAMVHYYAFDGHLPNVVPAEGGWLAVVGSGLWSAGPPRVALLASDGGKLLAEFSARKIADGDGVGIRLDPELVTEHAGRCLFLSVRSREASGSLWWKKIEFGPGRGIPLCIPVSYVSQYRVAGFLGYRISTGTRILETDQVIFSNDSCEERKQVSTTLEWPLHPGGRIADKGEWGVYEINPSSIDCRIEGNDIACSGWLGPARCDGGSGSGNGRVITEWHHIFSPAEEYPDPKEHRSAAISPGVDAAEQASVCVEMPWEKVSDEIDMWFDLFAVNAHQQRVFFSAPRVSVSELSHEQYQVPSYRIDADLEPGLESGEGQICVTIRSSECAY